MPAAKPAAKRHRLSGIELDEISMVDRPANPGARLALFKRDGDITDTAAAVEAIVKDAKSFNEIWLATDIEEEWWKLSSALRNSISSILQDDGVPNKKAAILTSINQFAVAVVGEVDDSVAKGTTMDPKADTISKADHEKALSDLRAELAKAQTDAKVAALLVEHRKHYDSLGDAAKADFLAKDEAGRAAIVKAASEPPDHIAKQMADLAKANRELQERLDKADAEKRDAAALAKAKEILGEAGGSAEELAGVIKNLDEAGVAALAKQFEGQRTLLKFAGGKPPFQPVGKTATGQQTEGVAKSAFAAKVDEVRKADPKLSKEQAEARVLESNPELYDQLEGAN